MKTLDVAVLAMLLGAVVAAPSCARATTQSPGLHVVATDAAAAQPHAGSRGATSQRGYLLAQYGGGDDDDGPSNNGGGGGGGGRDRDDDDDDRPSRGGGGGYRGGGGGPNIGGILNGIGAIIQQGQRNQRQQQQQQQQRVYPQRNYDEQAERDRLQRQIANQRKKQQALENKRIQDLKRKQADEIRRIKQRQKDTDDPRVPNPPPYVPPAVIPQPVPVGNDPNPVPPDDNCPDNFQQLRVGATTLYPYRTDYPADPRVCAGTTRNGCYLRVMSGPLACGSKPTCVMHCPPNVPILVPQPVPPPKPLPQACANPPCAPQPYPAPPQACTNPPCGPQPQQPYPVPVPPPVACAYPPCAPQPYPAPPQACTNPPCGPQPQPVPVIPDEPAVTTHLVTPTVEPDRPTTPAVTTHLVTPTVEPDRPTTPAVTTHLVTPTVEPDRPTTPAVTTHLVTPTVEPDRPTTPAVTTHLVTPTVEPDRPTTPAIPTHLMTPTVEPDQPTTPAVPTHLVTPAEEPDHPTTPAVTTHIVTPREEPDQPTTPAVPTHLVSPSDEPDHPTTPAIATHLMTPRDEPDEQQPQIIPAVMTITPRDTVEPPAKNLPPIAAPPTEPDFGFDDANPIQPTVDGKGCAPTGAVGIPTANFKNDPQYARKVFSGLMGAVPEVGGLLKPLVEYLWKDNGPDSMFNQMKDYVDRLVPELLTQDRLTEMENRLKGIKDNLDNYNGMSGSEKGSDLLVTLGAITTHSQDFLADNGVNRAAPDRTLAYFVEFGLLKLAVLKERLQRDKELWPEADAQKYAHDHAEREKQLNDAIRLLAKRAGEIKAALVKKRLEKLRPDNHDTYRSPRFGGHGYTHYYAAKDDFCDWRGPDHEGDEKAAQNELERRRKEVERTYSAAVDAILEPITQWASALPETIAADKTRQWENTQAQARAAREREESCSYCEAHGIIGIQ